MSSIPQNDMDFSEEDILYTKKREARFVWKLDLCLISWAWIAYTIKQIDASNYKTAYASGMKEALNLQGNELNYMDTFFRIGYAIFLIPSQLILSSVRPKYWLPPLELAWGILTAFMAVSQNVQGMYALRFFIGVFEASSYPGIISILCNWYTPSELATRVAIFGTSYPAASMFVSFMQIAIQGTLDGKQGIPGWKWLFIINGIMTVIVACLGFFFIPDVPGQSRVFWMNSEDDEMSRIRIDRVKKLPPTKMSWSAVKISFSGWVVYIFTLAYATWSWTQNSNSWFILYLKAVQNPDGSLRFNVQEINAIPIAGNALMMIAMVFFAWLSSKTGWRATWIVVQMLITLVGLIILSIWPASFALKMAGFFLIYTSNAGGPILVAWMADHVPIPEQRNIIIGVCVTLVYAIDSFANIFIYPASEAPNYRIGWKAASAFCVTSLFFVGIFKYLEVKKRQKAVTDQEHNQRPMDEHRDVVDLDEKI